MVGGQQILDLVFLLRISYNGSVTSLCSRLQSKDVTDWFPVQILFNNQLATLIAVHQSVVPTQLFSNILVNSSLSEVINILWMAARTLQDIHDLDCPIQRNWTLDWKRHNYGVNAQIRLLWFLGLWTFMVWKKKQFHANFGFYCFKTSHYFAISHFVWGKTSKWTSNPSVDATVR